MARHEVVVNATLATASLLLVIAGALSAQTVSAQTVSARDVVVQFCTLDAEGEQLTPSDRQKLISMFTGPAVPQPSKLILIKDFVVSHPFPEKDRVGFRVDYTPVGSIDLSQLRFSGFPPAIEMRADLFTIREPVGSANAGLVGESLEWRIEGHMPTPHMTVAAAIRYLSDLRSRARETSVKKHAEQLVNDLYQLR